jgi:hypothetical protein
MRLSYVLSFVRVVGLASSGTLNVYTQESYFILLYEAILNLSSKMLYYRAYPVLSYTNLPARIAAIMAS